MEIGEKNVEHSGSNSSNEDLSQYTDADESMSAPTEILAEFLSALMVRDYPSALKLCKIILQYEPDHETAKQFYPLIQEKILLQAANKKYQVDQQIEECSSEDDSTGNSDENGNIPDYGSDSASSGSDQRDAEETTASYSSLEDEVADMTLNDSSSTNNNSPDTSQQVCVQSQSGAHGCFDDNGNNLPSISTTSDSDSFPESKKVSARLKSLLLQRKSYKYAKSMPL